MTKKLYDGNTEQTNLSSSHVDNDIQSGTVEKTENRKRKRHSTLKTEDVGQNQTTDYHNAKKRRNLKSDSDNSSAHSVEWKSNSRTLVQEDNIDLAGKDNELEGMRAGAEMLEALATDSVIDGHKESTAEDETAVRLNTTGSHDANEQDSPTDKSKDNEVGGFTVLGSYGSKKTQKVGTKQCYILPVLAGTLVCIKVKGDSFLNSDIISCPDNFLTNG